DVVALRGMPLASEHIAGLGLFERRWPAGARIDVAAPSAGARPVVLVDGRPWSGSGPDEWPNARSSVQEEVHVAGRAYRFHVAAAGFWQVHREAPRVLMGAALAGTVRTTGGGDGDAVQAEGLALVFGGALTG